MREAKNSCNQPVSRVLEITHSGVLNELRGDGHDDSCEDTRPRRVMSNKCLFSADSACSAVGECARILMRGEYILTRTDILFVFQP